MLRIPLPEDDGFALTQRIKPCMWVNTINSKRCILNNIERPVGILGERNA